jgi:hypothetical protein
MKNRTRPFLLNGATTSRGYHGRDDRAYNQIGRHTSTIHVSLLLLQRIPMRVQKQIFGMFMLMAV